MQLTWHSTAHRLQVEAGKMCYAVCMSSIVLGKNAHEHPCGGCMILAKENQKQSLPLNIQCHSPTQQDSDGMVSIAHTCGLHSDFFCMRTSCLQACVIMPLALLFDEHCIILALTLSLTYTDALPGTRGACLV